jgi:hypothetical protein
MKHGAVILRRDPVRPRPVPPRAAPPRPVPPLTGAEPRRRAPASPYGGGAGRQASIIPDNSLRDVSRGAGRTCPDPAAGPSGAVRAGVRVHRRRALRGRDRRDRRAGRLLAARPRLQGATAPPRGRRRGARARRAGVRAQECFRSPGGVAERAPPPLPFPTVPHTCPPTVPLLTPLSSRDRCGPRATVTRGSSGRGGARGRAS